ncbi:hypothetical protein VOLCADRAFT_95590 [Volvox carteri f. nagariensis]|uniref:Uncharacterized protein n=1 Tax=Volvox carteri f. nagariensis TaxID=3068 RepID=D8U808_VOLCA|nr:uncharacterized protein VOLCADRAFT_95590 [Volvox carteri f. nagariensis]EFJ44135.1 hypothetical protein VOLCADRAFT_95590 [Volvox carteri f. nagariensis]|eukprot:XP_002954729.1 hypothetical protein VOLCADRAFT_95590 [Volvox carteri f. nagariensis]
MCTTARRCQPARQPARGDVVIDEGAANRSLDGIAKTRLRASIRKPKIDLSAFLVVNPWSGLPDDDDDLPPEPAVNLSNKLNPNIHYDRELAASRKRLWRRPKRVVPGLDNFRAAQTAALSECGDALAAHGG